MDQFGVTTTKAEKALRIEEPRDQGDVDDERSGPKYRHPVKELTNFQRQKSGGRKNREVLRPPLFEPETDRLQPLKYGVSNGDRKENRQSRAFQLQQVLKLALQPTLTVLLPRLVHLLFERIEASLGSVLEPKEVRTNGRQEKRNQGEAKGMRCLVESNQTHDDCLTERISATRFGQLGNRWNPVKLRDHRIGCRMWNPTIAAKAPGKTEQKAAYKFLINNGRSNINWQNWFLDQKNDFVTDRFSVPFIQIHPDDMATLGLKAGDMVEVFNDVGATQALAYPEPTARAGETFMLFGAPAGTQGNVVNAGVNELILPNYKQAWANIRKISDATPAAARSSYKSWEVTL